MENPLKVLQESVVQHLEGGTKGSKAPQFHEYIDGSDDLEPEKILRLKNDLLQIYKAFIEGMPFIKDTVEMRMPVHATGYSLLLGAPVEKDTIETIASLLNAIIDHCELAIIANCGFGKYSAGPEKIKEAQEQLRENIEVIYLPLPKGSMELKVVAYDSNNNPKHNCLVDGLWVPFKTIGLIRQEAEDVILAFVATMDYGSGNWRIDRLDTELLAEVAEKSSLFKATYQKLVGKDFEGRIREPNPEFIKFLRSSPHFQQTINRICNRWTR
ncbi:hypothetical protein KJ575_02555 [Patescibacteria group bacterium]|nr:hypothetical protein [Patescibacteria group bacterium]MBU4368572.1 hypothetical protein [Patescibacteria group bacterium]